MTDKEIILLANSEHPLEAVAIASFDILSGIRICQSWVFSNEELPASLYDIFKVALGNVHRQNEQAYEKPVTSLIELQSYNWLFVTATFFINKKPRSVYITVGMTLNMEKIPNNPHYNDVLINWIIDLATATKRLILNNYPYTRLRHLIEKATLEIMELSKITFPESPTFVPSPSDSAFYSIILSSHLQTQMHTIIESKSSEEARKIASFLYHLSLPYQQQFSTLDQLDHPLPGLFIQCVKTQNIPIEEVLMNFSYPCTWVRLPERKVYRTPDIDEQKYVRNEYFKYQLDQEDLNQKKVHKYGVNYKLLQVVSPVAWASMAVDMLARTPECNRYLLCEQHMNTLIRMSISLIALTNEKLKLLQVAALTNEHTAEIYKALHLSGQVDLKLIIGIAQLFDEKINRKICFRKEFNFTSL